jgi:hypothetical protein
MTDLGSWDLFQGRDGVFGLSDGVGHTGGRLLELPENDVDDPCGVRDGCETTSQRCLANPYSLGMMTICRT